MGARVESGQPWGVQAAGAESQGHAILTGTRPGRLPREGASFSKQSLAGPASRPLHMLFLRPGIFCITHHPLRVATSVYSPLALSSESLANLLPQLGPWGLLRPPCPLCSPMPRRLCCPGCCVQQGSISHCLGLLWELARLCMSGCVTYAHGGVCVPQRTPHCVSSGVPVLLTLRLPRPLVVPRGRDWRLCPTDWLSLPLSPP